MRKIELSFQKNIRDLGGLSAYNGLKVKSGLIYRGGFLGRVSKEDVKIIDSLHLTDIIDFRGSYEFEKRPDYPFKGVAFHNIPTMSEDVKKEKSKSEDSNLLWFIDERVSGFDHMYNLYPDLLLSDVAIDALKKFFRILIDNPGHVFYFHCSQGKDRAGLVAYVLEISLGVSKKDAREDYLLSNEAMKVRIQYHLDELKDIFEKEEKWIELINKNLLNVIYCNLELKPFYKKKKIDIENEYKITKNSILEQVSSVIDEILLKFDLLDDQYRKSEFTDMKSLLPLFLINQMNNSNQDKDSMMKLIEQKESLEKEIEIIKEQKAKEEKYFYEE